MRIRAIACTGQQRCEVVETELPDEPEGDEVLVEKVYACASPGTDRRCLSLAQEGGHEVPFILGYSSVGTVVAAGPEAALPVGTRVFCSNGKRLSMKACWGAYTSHGIHPCDSVFPLPEAVGFEQAGVTKLGAIAYHGLRLAQPMPHHKVAVVGLGIIGQLAARLYHAAGATVHAADPQERRRAAAAAQGVGLAVDPGNDLARAFAAVQPDGADIVVDATGAPAVLPQSVELARHLPWDESFTPPPKMVLQGSYPADFSLDYHSLFRREMPLLVPRDSRRLDHLAVLDLMARGLLRVDDLVADVRPAEDCQAAYDDLSQPDAPYLTTLFRW